MIKPKYPDLSDIEKKLRTHVSRTLAKSTKRPPTETASALLSWGRAQDLYDEMISLTGPLRGKKLLEVGCGYGLFLTICLNNKIKAEGVEPASQEFYKFTLNIAKEILKRSGRSKRLIKNSSGEKLPYKNKTFDTVVSLYTLEHVQNVEKVLFECSRVLKKGGYLYMVVPNYGSFWEGHYGIPWIPYIPKFMAKFYVKIFGKEPDIIKELQFVNQINLSKITKELPLKVENWGGKTFIDKVQDVSLRGGTLDSAKKILDILRFLRILTILARIACFINAQTPIVLVARKTK